MASGTINLGKSAASGYYIEAKIEWASVADAVANTSAVTAKLYVRKGSTTTILTIPTEGAWPYKLTVNGSTVSGTKTASVLLDWVLLATVTQSVVHNSNGAKSITLSGSVTGPSVSSFASHTSSGYGTAILDAIPRASTVGASDANIGATATISVVQKNAAYAHSIAYKFGDLAGYIKADGTVSDSEVKISATSIPFAVPENFYSQIPDKPSGECTLICKTYSGSAQIGDAQSCKFTVTAPKSVCQPDVDGTVADANEVTIALTGDASKLVRYKSTALCTITATAKNSASVASKKIGGVTVTGSTRSIEKMQASSVLFMATDSRKYSTSRTVDVDLIPYVLLTANVTARRIDPTSGNAVLEISGNYYNGSFGAADNELTVQYKIDSGEYVPLEPTLDGDTYKASAVLSGLDYRSSYEITVETSDKLETITKPATIGKGIPVFDWGENDFAFNVPVAAPSFLGLFNGSLDVGVVIVSEWDDLKNLVKETVVAMDRNTVRFAGILLDLDISAGGELRIFKGLDGDGMETAFAVLTTTVGNVYRLTGFNEGGQSNPAWAWDDWFWCNRDTGWVDLALDAAFALYEGKDYNRPRYRVSGNVVTVRGAVSPKVAFTSSSTKVVIASGIPAEYRPASTVYFVCQGSIMNRWCCSVNGSTGEVSLSKYGTTEYAEVPTDAWLHFFVTYQLGG